MTTQQNNKLTQVLSTFKSKLAQFLADISVIQLSDWNSPRNLESCGSELWLIEEVLIENPFRKSFSFWGRPLSILNLMYFKGSDIR